MKKKTNSLYKIYVSILGVLLISVFIQVVIYDRCKIKYIFAILGVFLMLWGMLYVVKSRNWMNVFFSNAGHKDINNPQNSDAASF